MKKVVEILENVNIADEAKALAVNSNELKYIAELFDSGYPGTTTKNFVGLFEEAFAEKFQSTYAITHVNGTATLHSALAARGIGHGDEVIVPPLTMASTSLAVLYTQATPVFADVDPETFTLNPESVRGKITPRTKAIIPVALYGLAPDMDPIMDLANQHNLLVIEDAAQCFLGKYHQRMVGTIGHVGSFSFQNSKHMTCGEGGIVITSDADLAEKIRRFTSLGYGLVGADAGCSRIDKRKLVNPQFERHVDLGYNYRLSEICAAVLLAQLEKLDHFVDMRRATATAFDEVVSSCPWLSPQKTPTGYHHAYWAYTVKIDPSCGTDMWQNFYDKFVEFGGEGFYGAWKLTYQEPLFKSGDYGDYDDGLCPVAERIQPYLMQFKTNYSDIEQINFQAEALDKTIRTFK